MDLTNSILWVLKIGDVDIWITESIFNTWLIMAALLIFAVIVRVKLKKFKEIPSGFQNVIESIIEIFDGFVAGSAGPHLMYLGNWFFMVFAFILFSNISGLVGLRPPTADWSVTFTFAVCTFVLIQIIGLKYQKGKYLKSFIEPFFLFLPLNIIGELARPISLSFRLFGNVLSGMLLITMYYTLVPFALRFFIPVALHGIFDLIFGALQTYIFCVLSLAFIGAVAEVE